MGEFGHTPDESPAARSYAGAVMRELVIPLEALNNLLYLIALSAEEPSKVAFHAEMAQKELLKINKIARQTLSSCSEGN
jgi:hypothetical protein